MKIGIIGAGKVGIAIGSVMKRNGLEVVGVSDIRQEQLSLAREYLGDNVLYTEDNVDVVRISDAVAITTQDGVIKDVAKEIDERIETLHGKLFFHTSGAHPSSILSPLDRKGALIGALHPLQTFPDIHGAIEVLPETYVFIEGDKKALGELELLGSHIGYKVLTIGSEDKVLYHLSAVFVCNLLCALLYTGERIMDKIDIGLAPFFPIIHATLKNIENRGPLKSLTGPLVRGDTGTVVDHIQAMQGMQPVKKVYKALSLVALDMVKERDLLSDETLATLHQVLEEIDD